MSCSIKVILLLTFLWGNLAYQELGVPIFHADCPRIDDINHPVMLPYRPDCSKYYTCLNGMAYLQQCPHNLHWSTTTYRCDYPEVARCQPDGMPIPIPVPQVTTDIVYKSYPNNCNKYYKCQAMACPSNLYWNSYTQQCDYPQHVQCPFRPSLQIGDGSPYVAV